LRVWYVAGGVVAVLAGLVALCVPAIVQLEGERAQAAKGAERALYQGQ
jgi:hypothetical protein